MCPDPLDQYGNGARHEAGFPRTRWSLILNAQDDDPDALAGFCRAYWFPLYSYARRLGLGVADAEDLTQSFFERLLARDLLSSARRERGRLRSFLLRSFKNFSTEQWRKEGAQKRGGNSPMLALDALSAEELLAMELQDRATPELEYERAWSRELLRQALQTLEAVYESSGNGEIFRALRDQLADGSSGRSYQEIAAALGVSEASARFAAFKLRQRYRETLREIVANTVASDAEVDEELAYLQTLFQA
jgi:RNA polymerase sigma-70 factor (ECF subfamily)